MRTHLRWAELPGTRDMGGASAVPHRWRRSDGGRGSEHKRGPSSAAAVSWMWEGQDGEGVSRESRQSVRREQLCQQVTNDQLLLLHHHHMQPRQELESCVSGLKKTKQLTFLLW